MRPRQTHRILSMRTLEYSETLHTENAIKIAVNDALEDAKDTSAKKLKAVTGGLTDGLPGF